MTYEEWLAITRLPADFSSAAMCLYLTDQSFAYALWRKQNSESIYQCQRTISGWFATSVEPSTGKRGGRNRKRNRGTNRVRPAQ